MANAGDRPPRYGGRDQEVSPTGNSAGTCHRDADRFTKHPHLSINENANECQHQKKI